MAALESRSSLKAEDSLGPAQSLSCPLLEKLRDAIEHLGRYTRGVPLCCGETSYIAGCIEQGQGDFRAGWGRTAVSWDKDAGVLTLCFNAYDPALLAMTPDEATHKLAAVAKEPASAPTWLAEVDPDALVSNAVLAMFEGQRATLSASIDALTGGVAPRQIKCFGWCIAGMTATVAAAWIALRYPTADIRCITFGGQKLGNRAFARTFRWLVGLSYRVVYSRDPVPSHKAKAGLLSSELVHVHGEIYIDDALMHPGSRPTPKEGVSEDHAWVKYSQALGSKCQFERELAFQEESARNPADADSPATRLSCSGDQAQPALASSSEKAVCRDGQVSDDRASTGISAPAAAKELTEQLAQADVASTAEAFTMLAQSPAARESCDLGQLDGMPDMVHSVFAQAGTRPPCQDSAAAEAVLSAAAGSPAAMARDDSANVNSGAARCLVKGQPAQPQDGQVVKAGASGRDSCAAHSLEASSLTGPADAISTSLEKVLLAGKITQAAILSAAAYRDEAGFRKTTGIDKCRLVIDSHERNTHVHVGWLDNGTAVLAFRGTATMQDGMADVQIMHRSVHYLRKHFPGSRAHLGFLKQFMGVCNPDKTHGTLAAVVMELSGGQVPSRVLCCGHSLGGALATLGAAWAALQWSQADVRCITFGSPRVGNRPFKQAFQSLVGTSYRMVHGRDPVPALPPSIVYAPPWQARYKHVQGAIHIRPDGSMALKSRPWFFKYPPNLMHHGMVHYNAGICLHFPELLRALPVLSRLISKAKASAAHAGTDGLTDGANPASQGMQTAHAADDDMSPDEATSLQSALSLRLLCGLRA